VNSSTSNSDLHRLYVLRLFVLALVPVAGLFALGVYLQPLFGDLTRIGSYAEKDFGWNKPQLEFQQPLSDIGLYARYHDVVVLGDSFSTGRPNLHWQNYVVAATGLKVVTLDVNKLTLNQVLGNQVFQKSPPEFLIFESVERALPDRLLRENSQPCSTTEAFPRFDTTSTFSSVNSTVHLDELKGVANYVERTSDWSEIKLGYVMGYLNNSLLRYFTGDAHTDAGKVELSRSAPFSSVNKQNMLVYKDDFRKVKAWHDMGLSELVCRTERMRGQVEANGHTRFLLMVAPDKLTAYADFIRDRRLREISALSDLSARLPDVMPDLNQTLTSAIHKGETDVYLPDDTHWGSRGYQIAAETLIKFMRNPE
jgi:hypothetical protein